MTDQEIIKELGKINDKLRTYREEREVLRATLFERSLIKTGDMVTITYSNDQYTPDKAFVSEVRVTTSGEYKYKFVQALEDGKTPSKRKFKPATGSYTVHLTH